jgi:hypothetical protein
MARTLLLLLVAAAGAARADPAPGFHIALAGGTGLPLFTLGPRLEIRFGMLAVFGAVDFDLLTGRLLGGGKPGYEAGVRWFPSDGHGFVLSVHGAWMSDFLSYAPNDSEYHRKEQLYLGATLGGRYRTALGIFLEGGLGLTLLRETGSGVSPSPMVGCKNINYAYSCVVTGILPDVDLAAGFEF